MSKTIINPTLTSVQIVYAGVATCSNSYAIPAAQAAIEG